MGFGYTLQDQNDCFRCHGMQGTEKEMKKKVALIAEGDYLALVILRYIAAILLEKPDKSSLQASRFSTSKTV